MHLRLRTSDFWLTFDIKFFPKVNRVRWLCYCVPCRLISPLRKSWFSLSLDTLSERQLWDLNWKQLHVIKSGLRFINQKNTMLSISIFWSLAASSHLFLFYINFIASNRHFNKSFDTCCIDWPFSILSQLESFLFWPFFPLTQWFGSYLNPHATSGDDTSAKLSLRPPFTSPVQWHLLILAFLGLKGYFVLFTLCSSAFCH